VQNSQKNCFSESRAAKFVRPVRPSSLNTANPALNMSATEVGGASFRVSLTDCLPLDHLNSSTRNE